jgi:phosphohistidine phosphatase
VKLVLLRHAKSAWPDVPDHERPLARRGRRDAPAVGHWLLVAGHVPDLVLCSAARRARQTWQLAQAEIGPPVPVSFDDGVYQATAEGLLAGIRLTPPEPQTLLVVGHDPAIPQLAFMLIRDVAPVGQAVSPIQAAERPDLLSRMRVKFPTAAVAVLEFAGSAWPQLSPGRALLTEFVTPRDIPRWPASDTR